MAKTQLLSQLKDVHLPPEISWWPLAIGWWLIIGLVLLALCLWLLQVYRRAKKARVSRLALIELKQLQTTKTDSWLPQLEVLLKRACLGYFSKQQVSQLSGQPWIDFLIRTGANVWSEPALFTLRDQAFIEPATIDNIHRSLIFEQSRQWLLQLPQAQQKLHGKLNKKNVASKRLTTKEQVDA